MDKISLVRLLVYLFQVLFQVLDMSYSAQEYARRWFAFNIDYHPV
jgi:hypothetical protein